MRTALDIPGVITVALRKKVKVANFMKDLFAYRIRLDILLVEWALDNVFRYQTAFVEWIAPKIRRRRFSSISTSFHYPNILLPFTGSAKNGFDNVYYELDNGIRVRHALGSQSCDTVFDDFRILFDLIVLNNNVSRCF